MMADDIRRHRLLILAMDEKNLLCPTGLSNDEMVFLDRWEGARSVFRPSERNFGYVLTHIGANAKASLQP
jgi:hypothetical protein